MRAFSFRLIVVLGMLLALGSGVFAYPVDAVPREAIEAALAEAGANRPELERALDHKFMTGHAEKRVALRFLIANMPGKGYWVPALRSESGTPVTFDPSSFRDGAEARKGFRDLEKRHGRLHLVRSTFVSDLRTIGHRFLITHVENAVRVWKTTPASRRVSYWTFLNFILPYRCGYEPVEGWLGPLMASEPHLAAEESGDSRQVWERVREVTSKRVRFDERFAIVPSNRTLKEILASGLGSHEDLARVKTYFSRACGLPVAIDCVPGQVDSWMVLLDSDGRGCDPTRVDSPKVYRRTYLQRGSLDLTRLVPMGHHDPSTVLGSTRHLDVTSQYAATTHVRVAVPESVKNMGGPYAYLCVFDREDWVPVHRGRISNGFARFTAMGRGTLYLPVIRKAEGLIAAASPRIVARDGLIDILSGEGGTTAATLSAVQNSHSSSSPAVVSRLVEGKKYRLDRWDEGWTPVRRFVAGEEAVSVDGLPRDGLFRLVEVGGKAGQPFTIVDGGQRFW